MTYRKEFEKMIEKKRQEIQSLEVQLREAKSYIQALQDAIRKLPREGVNSGGAESVLRSGSNIAKARESILKAGRPLHVEEIVQKIGKAPTKKNKISLSGSIAAYVRKNEIFTRTEPNTFGLIELNHHIADSDDDLPDDFGGLEDDEIPFS